MNLDGIGTEVDTQHGRPVVDHYEGLLVGAVLVVEVDHLPDTLDDNQIWRFFCGIKQSKHEKDP